MNEAIETLVVEDNPGDAAFLGHLLAAIDTLQFRIDQAVRLEDAMSLVSQHDYSLIFLDLSLPDSVGYQTFEKLVAAVPDVPIIVMTGVGDATLAGAAIHRGVQDFIVKGSINSWGLDRAVRYAFQRKRLERELRQLNEHLQDRVAERTEELEQSVAMLSQELATYKKAQSTDPQTDKRFEELIEAMPLAFWMSLNDNRTVYCNNRFEQVMGRERGTMNQWPEALLEIVHPDDRTRVAAQTYEWLQQAGIGHVPGLTLRYRLMRPDGQCVHILSRIFGLYGEDNGFKAVCCFAEEANPATASITPDDQVIVIDQYGHIKLWQAQLATGIAAENAEGKTLDQLQEQFGRRSTWGRLKNVLHVRKSA